MSVSVNVPEDPYRFEERLLELERLKEKAAQGSYEKFLGVMSKVHPVEPPDYDRL